MEKTVLSVDDINFFTAQPQSEVITMLGQMATLIEDITNLQENTNNNVEIMFQQEWFKRMWSTVSGENDATKQEFQKSQDKVVEYIVHSVVHLYQNNRINQQVMCSLGNRMNELYMQMHGNQQQILENMGAFVATLNEKIGSTDNFQALISEIQNGVYKNSNKIYSLCMILAQLDKRTMDDSQKVNLLQNTLEQSGIVTNENVSIVQYLRDIVALPQEKVGAIYIELCTFRNSFPTNLFVDMIEGYHFLPNIERTFNKEDVLIQRVLDKYKINADASFSICEISNIFIESKRNSLVDLQNIKTLASNENGACEYTDEKIREIVYKLNNENKFDELIEFVRPLAEQGNPLAQNSLARCYYHGLGVSQDYEQAIKWYKKSAEQGNKLAQDRLGKYYYFGKGVPQNYEKAVELWEKSAENGSEYAQYSLGNCYYFGNGVPQDYKKAIEWYKKSAEKDFSYAQCNLGICYKFGIGVPKNYELAIQWYEKSAELGNEIAEKSLGDFYYDGCGVLQDYEKAVKWYKKSAERGNKSAQYILGRCYYKGEGVQKNYELAFKWYEKSAKQGNNEAQLALAKCYLYGKGVSKNLSESKKYYRLSADQGNEEAIRKCKCLNC